MRIEILGTGCAKCQATEENVRKALAELGIAAEVVHVRNPREFAKYGIMFTPAIVIDGKVRISGHVPSVEEVKSLLRGGNDGKSCDL
ncbi:MAG: thioredoxin family protein [Candidatus Bipolaricaulota bacterium]|nr:thioredoxin family protein [Candidatus Bipolaricaulota bacterium]MDW8152569.1 thioredoxin family protein [Candidatus Bipolaricaulota bacterium]